MKLEETLTNFLDGHVKEYLVEIKPTEIDGKLLQVFEALSGDIKFEGESEDHLMLKKKNDIYVLQKKTGSLFKIDFR